MDHIPTIRCFYELINAGEIDAFGELLADDFVEHEEAPGLAPTKAGVMDFFRTSLVGMPDMRMNVEDIFASGDKVVARVRLTGGGTSETVPAKPRVSGRYIRGECRPLRSPHANRHRRASLHRPTGLPLVVGRHPDHVR